MPARRQKPRNADLLGYLLRHHAGIGRIEVVFDIDGQAKEFSFVESKPAEVPGRRRHGVPGQRLDTVPTGKIKAQRDEKLQALVEEVFRCVGPRRGGHGVIRFNPASQEVIVAYKLRAEQKVEQK